MNKSLSKAIMLRSKFRNIFLKNRTEENRRNYSKQRNLCVALLCKSNREYFGNLEEKKVCDSKKFWSVVKPLLSNKVISNEKIILIGNNNIIENDEKTATVLNNFFSNVITSLNITQYNETEPVSQNINDPLIATIMKYRSHSTIIAIKDKCNSDLHFNFSFVEYDEIMKQINNLKTNKATQNNDIPTKLITENSDFIFENLNDCIAKSLFSSFLKNAMITPVHKKGTKTSKDHYRPASIFSNISKIYERFIFKQMSKYFQSILPKYQCDFRKGFIPQHCLLAMLEKWKLAVDNKKTFGALLTDLSKAFDCLPHDFLVAKLNAYGFSLLALRLLLSYLSNRKQRTKINSKFSLWEEILLGVPQGSILGPLLFNMFICDLFFIMNNIDFPSYADDNAPFIVGEDVGDVIFKLQNASKTLFQWFYDNQMKANPEKYHFICSFNEKLNIVISNQQQ